MPKVVIQIEDCQEKELNVLKTMTKQMGSRVTISVDGSELVKLNNKKAVEEGEITYYDITLIESENTFRFKEEEIVLTFSQKKILEWFFRNPDRIASRATLTEVSHRNNETVSDRNIDSLVKHIRKRLKKAEAGRLADNIVAIYGEGYKLKTK